LTWDFQKLYWIPGVNGGIFIGLVRRNCRHARNVAGLARNVTKHASKVAGLASNAINLTKINDVDTCIEALLAIFFILHASNATFLACPATFLASLNIFLTMN